MHLYNMDRGRPSTANIPSLIAGPIYAMGFLVIHDHDNLIFKGYTATLS